MHVCHPQPQMWTTQPHLLPTPHFFFFSGAETIGFATYSPLWSSPHTLGHYIWHWLHIYDRSSLENNSGYLSSYDTSNSLGNAPFLLITSTKILLWDFLEESCSDFSSLSKSWTPNWITCLSVIIRIRFHPPDFMIWAGGNSHEVKGILCSLIKSSACTH